MVWYERDLGVRKYRGVVWSMWVPNRTKRYDNYQCIYIKISTKDLSSFTKITTVVSYCSSVLPKNSGKFVVWPSTRKLTVPKPRGTGWEYFLNKLNVTKRLSEVDTLGGTTVIGRTGGRTRRVCNVTSINVPGHVQWLGFTILVGPVDEGFRTSPWGPVPRFSFHRERLVGIGDWFLPMEKILNTGTPENGKVSNPQIFTMEYWRVNRTSETGNDR